MIEILKNEKKMFEQEKCSYSINKLKEDVKVDSIVTELGKYSETVKKYKMNFSMAKSKRTESSLSESILNESTIKDGPPPKERNRKNELLRLLRVADGETSKS